MGNHSKPSVARARLSTLAVTTSLGVAGAGVMAGTANAASPGQTAPDGTIANLATTPGVVAAGGTVHLNASASTIGHGPAAASMYTFHCDASDTVAPTNINTAGDQADCVYPAAGAFTASVAVDDGHKTGSTPDGQSTATLPVEVFTPAASGTAAVAPVLTDLGGLTVKADISGSAVGANIDLSKSVVDWGDHHTSPIVVATDGKLSVPNHTYAAAGSFPVTINLFDTGAGTTPTSTANATANVSAVTAAITAKQVAPYTVAADLTGSGINNGVVGNSANYDINWGDGPAGSPDIQRYTAITPAPKHTYVLAGNYMISVKVTDTLGDSATAQLASSLKVDNTQPAPPAVNRGWGQDRYQTGISLSGHHWADKGVTNDAHGRVQANAVVLATGTSFPDALAGVPLAKAKNGPLLLTDGSAATVNSGVLTEIQRILLADKSHTIFILGGQKAVSAGIESQLNLAGYNVVRLAGQDRFGTALAIAEDPRAMNNPDHVVVARGDNGNLVNGVYNGFADALAAGPYAADVFHHGGAAIVLTNGTAFDNATKAYVQSKINNAAVDVVAIGGPAVTAVAALPGAVELHEDSTQHVVGNFAAAKGGTRYDTARIVAMAFDPNDKVGVATGTQFADALTGGAYMAAVDGPLLLTDPSAESPELATAISNVAVTTGEVDIFGGEKAVTPAVANAIMSQVKQTVLGQFGQNGLF